VATKREIKSKMRKRTSRSQSKKEKENSRNNLRPGPAKLPHRRPA
jgi:hypothetical protein